MSEAGAAGAVETASTSIAAEHARRLFPWVKPYYEEPLVLAEGEGVRVRDVDGHEYLDLFAGILTTSVGHCHPRVVGAVREQSAKLGHSSTLYVTEPQLEAAGKLMEIAPRGLDRVAFTNSGTEAVETAIMAARMFTGRHEIVALRMSYSGRSLLANTMTAVSSWTPLGAALPGVVHARAPYPYRSPVGPDAPKCTDFFIDDLVETIETTTSGKPAAFFAETIMGVGGYIVPPPDYFGRASEVIRSYGGLFICDEVQAGFGRTGKWFGIEHWEVEPDLMVMAKGIANGFPVGATLARGEVADAWQGLSISTYGGNPVSMAATSATLDVMREEDVPVRSAARGDQLRAGLEALREEHAWIGEVRGMGLMQGLELVTDRDSKEPDPGRAGRLLEATKEEGLLIGRGGLVGQVIRIGPSLLISEAEMDEGIDRLSRACRAIA